jgi:HSP20 family protein
MRLNRFEPWSVVDLVNRDLARLPNGRIAAVGHTDWQPAVDIIEQKQGFVLRADLPGVNPADIEVSMDAGVLTVSGQRNAETPGDDEKRRRSERVSGSFLRRFSLPDTADAEAITASNKHGILEVNIPKKADVQPRRITVEAA